MFGRLIDGTIPIDVIMGSVAASLYLVILSDHAQVMDGDKFLAVAPLRDIGVTDYIDNIHRLLLSVRRRT